MKKIRDFIYNCNDIFLTLLIIAIAGSVILWRVQIIMGYSGSTETQSSEQKIDIDFSDIDLSVSDNEDAKSDSGNEASTDESGNEETPLEVSIDKNFVSPVSISVTIPSGCEYSKAVRLIAESYGLDTDSYSKLYALLFTAGAEIGADTRIQIGTFDIPQGSDLTTIMKIISKMD